MKNLVKSSLLALVLAASNSASANQYFEYEINQPVTFKAMGVEQQNGPDIVFNTVAIDETYTSWKYYNGFLGLQKVIDLETQTGSNAIFSWDDYHGKQVIFDLSAVQGTFFSWPKYNPLPCVTSATIGGTEEYQGYTNAVRVNFTADANCSEGLKAAWFTKSKGLVGWLSGNFGTGILANQYYSLEKKIEVAAPAIRFSAELPSTAITFDGVGKIEISYSLTNISTEVVSYHFNNGRRGIVILEDMQGSVINSTQLEQPYVTQAQGSVVIQPGQTQEFSQTLTLGNHTGQSKSYSALSTGKYKISVQFKDFEASIKTDIAVSTY